VGTVGISDEEPEFTKDYFASNLLCGIQPRSLRTRFLMNIRWWGQILVSAAFLIGAAACEANTQTPGVFQGEPFPPGTVGHEVSGYTLTMIGVRQWYGVIHDLYAQVELDPSIRIKMDFPLDGEFDHHLAALRSEPLLLATLNDRNLSVPDFLRLSVVVGLGRTYLHILETEGEDGLPDAIDRRLLGFMLENRAEIEAIEAGL
jgi:hypothetical protein